MFKNIPVVAATIAATSIISSNITYQTSPVGIYHRVAPSIVTVTAKKLQKDPFSPRSLIETPQSKGTGFKYKDVIVTNAHVIEGTFVVEVDGEPAEILNINTTQDLAVLQVPTLTESISSLHACFIPPIIGQQVLAIGNPFGFEKSMSEGIISGVQRIMSSGERTMTHMIQTDAPINPGNSGGPLLDADFGCVLGMNSVIVSPDGANAGIGFAIPIDQIESFIDGTSTHPTPKLGVILLPDQIAELLGIKGLLVTEVVPYSPAEKAGIKITRRDDYGRPIFGDLILGANNQMFYTSEDLMRFMDSISMGDVVKFTVLRGDHIIDLKVDF